MLMKTKVYLIGIIVALTLAVSALVGNNRGLRKEKAVLEGNQETLLELNTEVSDSYNQLIVERGTLTKVIKSDAKLKAVLHDSLQLKTKEVEQLTKALSTSRVRIKTELRDTTIYKTDTFYVVKTFNWKNPWYCAKGFVSLQPDSIDMTIEGRDTIYYVGAMERQGKWFLPKLIRKPKATVKIWNANPHQEIVIERSFKLKE